MIVSLKQNYRNLCKRLADDPIIFERRKYTKSQEKS